MGLLVSGEWKDEWYDTKSTGGSFKRSVSQFRNQLEFPAEEGRYHVYVASACPWAHRVLIVRALKKLESTITVSVVAPLMLENGWEFGQAHPDHLFGSRFLYQIYLKADPSYTGRVTVPILWDKQEQTIVNNESSELIIMLNEVFEREDVPDLYPMELREEIERINERVYHSINNGVYKSGFATSQSAYKNAVRELFSTMQWLDEHLESREFLAGGQLTLADIRLFCTLVRFDPVYTLHFKCSQKRLIDYPNLWRYTKSLYRTPAFHQTFDLGECMEHYYGSHRGINPHGIIPEPPLVWMNDQ